MSRGRAVFTLVFLVIFVIGAVWTINNSFQNIVDAEKWVAYEHGACMFAEGYTEEQCLAMAGEVSWPAINGKQAFDKYYGEGKAQWIYGENPRLGLGIANFVLPIALASPLDRGSDTGNPFSRIERGVPYIPLENATYTCPDGTVIPATQECDTPTGPAECPPNKVVMMNAAGECIIIGDPIQCPDGTLVPTESECSTPPSIVAPIPQQSVPLIIEEKQEQSAKTPSSTETERLPTANPINPLDETPAERAAEAEQDSSDSDDNNDDGGSEDDGDNDGVEID